MKLKTLLAAAVAAVLFAPGSALAGGGFEWTGEGNGSSWTDSCNWWPKDSCKQEYPGKSAPDDTASIAPLPGKSPPRVTLGDNLTLASLSMSGNSSLTGGSLRLTRGMTWAGGSLFTNVTLTRGSVGSISGQPPKRLGANLTNSGILVVGGDTRMSVTRGVKLTNNELATLNLAHGARFEGLECCVSPARIVNNGRLSVSGGLVPLPGAKTVLITSISFDASGAQSIKGTLQVEKAPGTIDLGTRFDGGGTFKVTNGARLEMKGPFNISKGTTLELAAAGGSIFQGQLAGKGKMFGGGELLWKGGRIDATLTLEEIQTVLEGPDEKSLGGSIVNDGHLVFLGSNDKKKPTGALVMGQKTKFLNLGSFVAHAGTRINGLVCCNTPAVFDNEGVFSVVRNPKQPAERVVVSNIRFYVARQLHLERADLEVLNGLATLALLNVTGTGTIELSTASDTTIQGKVTAEKTIRVLQLGDLDGKGSFGGGGKYEWRTGTINAELAIERDSVFAFDGSTQKYLGEKAILTTRGTALLTPDRKQQTVAFYPPARYVNAGTLTARGETEFRGQSCCRNPATFANLGLVTLERGRGPAPVFGINYIVVENRGTVDVNVGTLGMGGAPYVQYSGETRLSGGLMVSLEVTDLRGGRLTGSGKLHSNLWNRAVVAPGDPERKNSTGVIHLTGDYTQLPTGKLEVDVAGLTPGAGHDQLLIDKGSRLAGRLEIRTKDGWAPALSTRVKVLDSKLARFNEFSQAGNLGLPDGREWGVSYTGDGVALVARRA